MQASVQTQLPGLESSSAHFRARMAHDREHTVEELGGRKGWLLKPHSASLGPAKVGSKDAGSQDKALSISSY